MREPSPLARLARRCRPRRLFGQAPATMTSDGARPMVTDGVASTIVDETTGLVWARADRASRMVVEYATTEAFRRSTAGDRAGGAGRQRLHRARAPVRPAPRPAGVLPRALPGPRRPAPLERAGDGQLLHRAGGHRARRVAGLLGRHGGAGVGARSRLRRHADLRQHARRRARPVRQPRRRHLRRSAGRSGRAARRRRHLAQPAEPGQGQGGRNRGRVPRQLSLQPAGRPHAPLQPVGGAAHRVGRSRGPRQLVHGAAPGRRCALHGGVGGAAGRARPPGALRVHAAAG